MKSRKETRKIMVGNVQIGGNNKVVIQSMTNTKTKNIADTVKQILALEKLKYIEILNNINQNKSPLEIQHGLQWTFAEL